MSLVAVKGFHPRKWYENIPRKTVRVLPTLGTVLLLVSILMIPSIVFAVINHENIHMFFWQAVIGFGLGVYIKFRYKLPKDMCPSYGLVMIFSTWFMLFIYGMIPYLIYGMNPLDAFFESVSGFTTTGASIISDVTTLPESLLIWRVMTCWIGGIIIVMIFMLIMPMVVSGGRSILNNETSGASSANLSVRLAIAGKQFLIIYTLLTGIFAVIYILLGQFHVDNISVVDGICLAMSVISISGFVNVNNSLAEYGTAVAFVTAIFLLISASNFYLHFRLVVKREFGYVRSEEFRVMIIWFLVIMGYIFIQVFTMHAWDKLPGESIDKVSMIMFSVVSFGTTAGYTTLDMSKYWVCLGTMIFLLLMFVGGSAGSTSGGVKISRAIIIVKSMINEVRQVVHPNAVYRVRYEGHGVSTSTVHNAMVITIIFLLVIVVSAILFCMLYPLDESTFLSVSLITNTGTAIGSNSSDYSGMPPWAKLFSCLLMFLGRMEVLTVMAMLTPSLWKEYFGPRTIEAFKDKVFAKKQREQWDEKRKDKKKGKISREEPAEDEAPVQDAPAT